MISITDISSFKVKDDHQGFSSLVVTFLSKKKGGTYFLWVNVTSLRRDALL